MAATIPLTHVGNAASRPEFVISPTSPVTFKAGYIVDSTSIRYGEDGIREGLPACSGEWIGPITTGAPSVSTVLTIGWNLATGFVVLESATAGWLTHEEWRCTLTPYAEATSCPPDHQGIHSFPATPRHLPTSPRPLDGGWSSLEDPVHDRSVAVSQSGESVTDLRVSSVRAREVRPESGIPFTGRVSWSPSPTSYELRSDDYIFGWNACNGAVLIGSGPIDYAAEDGQAIIIGSRSTSGVPIRNIVPLRPLPPMGDWGATTEGCNSYCRS